MYIMCQVSFYDIRDLHRARLASLGMLAGELAHEFNNIMTSVLLHSQVALLEAKVESALARDLTLVIVGAERARNLVNGILSFGSETYRQEPCVFSLRSVVDAALPVLRAIASGVEITLTTSADTDYVFGDPGLLQEVVMDLCVQCWGAKQRRAALVLTLRRMESAETESNDASVLLEITGGHDLEDQRLSSIHDIVRTMNGSLHWDSSLEAGATVRLCLPVAQAPSQQQLRELPLRAG